MTKEQMLELLKLLSAVDTLLMTKGQTPDHIYDQITRLSDILQKEILK